MPKTKRSWDLLDDDSRRACINTLIDFYASERDETIGQIAASELCDVFLQVAAPLLFNSGVEATLAELRTRFDSMALDIEVKLLRAG